MNLDKLSELGFNLYDVAAYDAGEITVKRFAPSNNCNDCYSVAKAFTMTAIGMLADEGRLTVDTPIGCVLTEADERWQRITVEHALTHRIGYGTGLLDIDAEDVCAWGSTDYLALALKHETPYPPGTHYQYTDAAFYILSRVVARITGTTLQEFLRERLFNPLRFREVAFSFCPMGHAMGATGLYISAADMLKLAITYIGGGVYEGRRIVSEAWVKTVLEKGYEFGRMSDGFYGKGGMYGQMLMFNPERKRAYAFHTFTKNHDIAPLIRCLIEMP